jgi:hypothetical protein
VNGGYLLNKKGIFQLQKLKPTMKMEFEGITQEFIDKVNAVQNTPLTLDLFNLDILIDIVIEEFRKEHLEVLSQLREATPPSGESNMAVLTAYAAISKINNELTSSFEGKVSQFLKLVEFAYLSRDKNSFTLDVFQVLQLCKAFRQHEKGPVSIAQSKEMRLLLSDPLKIRRSNSNKILYTLRTIEKNPFVDSSMDSLNYSDCRYFLLQKLSEKLSTLDSDDIISFKFYLECFFPLNKLFERYPLTSDDATASMFQIIGGVSGDERALLGSNVIGDAYTDLYTLLLKNIV